MITNFKLFEDSDSEYEKSTRGDYITVYNTIYGNTLLTFEKQGDKYYGNEYYGNDESEDDNVLINYFIINKDYTFVTFDDDDMISILKEIDFVFSEDCFLSGYDTFLKKTDAWGKTYQEITDSITDFEDEIAEYNDFKEEFQFKQNTNKYNI